MAIVATVNVGTLYVHILTVPAFRWIRITWALGTKCLAPVAFFPALGIGSRVFPRLAVVACFPRLAPLSSDKSVHLFFTIVMIGQRY